MRTYPIYSIIIIFGILTGCATGRIGTLPFVNDMENSSEIYILRGYNFISSSYSAYVSFDNNDILAIRNGQYTNFHAPTGDHLLGVRLPGMSNNTMKLSLNPKNKYYFGVSVGFGNYYLLPMTEADSLPYLESEEYMVVDNNIKPYKTIKWL